MRDLRLYGDNIISEDVSVNTNYGQKAVQAVSASLRYDCRTVIASHVHNNEAEQACVARRLRKAYDSQRRGFASTIVLPIRTWMRHVIRLRIQECEGFSSICIRRWDSESLGSVARLISDILSGLAWQSQPDRRLAA